jgi:shikimate dehydrogenase
MSERGGGATRVVGVIGWPVAHSVSPAMHNAAFHALGLNWCYVPLPVRPDRVAEAVAGVRALGMQGVNITVPHKQALLGLVDELSPAARAVGAVNTLCVVDEGTLLGHNTDAAGFMRALHDEGVEPDETTRALVLGAGGSARAVVYALAERGVRVTIANRTASRAEALAETLAGVNPSATLRWLRLTEEALRSEEAVDLVVNTTSVGMWPETEGCPWPERVPFPAQAFLFDLVYNPRETRLMAMARQAGARVTDGLMMLVHQGAAAFELWTGVAPPVDVMATACTAALGGG